MTVCQVRTAAAASVEGLGLGEGGAEGSHSEPQVDRWGKTGKRKGA